MPCRFPCVFCDFNAQIPVEIPAIFGDYVLVSSRNFLICGILLAYADIFHASVVKLGVTTG